MRESEGRACVEHEWVCSALWASEWIGLCLNEDCQIGRADHVISRKDCVWECRDRVYCLYKYVIIQTKVQFRCLSSLHYTYTWMKPGPYFTLKSKEIGNYILHLKRPIEFLLHYICDNKAHFFPSNYHHHNAEKNISSYYLMFLKSPEH